MTAERARGGSAGPTIGLGLCGFALMLDGLDNQLLGLLIPSLIKDWQLDRNTFAPFIIATVLLMSAGTSIGGWLGDRYGRKPVLVVSLLWLGALTMACGYAANPTQLLVLRGLAAIGMGGVMPNATALLAEFVPQRHRSLSVSLGVAAIPLGGVLGGLAGSLVIPMFGWRAMFELAGVVTIMAGLVSTVALPESPSLAEARSLRAAALGVEVKGQTLLGKTFRRDTLALWCALFFSMLGVYSMANWVPTMLDQENKGPAVASLGLAIFNFGGLLGGLVIAAAMDRFGSRKPLFLTGVIGIFAAALAVSAIISDNSTLITVLPLGVMGACIAGMQAALIAFSAQVYPTAIRSTGMGAALAVGRLGALASSVTGTFLLGFGSGHFLIAMGAAVLIAGTASLIARQRAASQSPAVLAMEKPLI